MFNDLLAVFQWWAVFFVLGIIFLPITAFLFPFFRDRGYAFSKVIGIALVAYSLFFLNILHILQFTFTSILLLTWGWLLLNIFIGKRIKLRSFVKPLLPIFLLQELVFLIALMVWSYVRAHEPSIHGLEKYMDFGFVNSILRSSYMPPQDMWFPPLTINYYYFGHYVTALLTKLSALPSSVTYNLMIATLFAFTFTLPFSLIYNIFQNLKLKKQSIIGGIIVGFLTSIGGNLHTIYAFFAPYKGEEPVPFWTKQFLPHAFPNAYWYANATRFIQNTIHEFPIYSFVVSDLHGHVIDIPFVFLTLAFAYTLLLLSEIKTYHILFSSLLLAIMYMTNAWDGIIYFILLALIFLFRAFTSSGHSVQQTKIKNEKFQSKSDQPLAEKVKNLLKIGNYKLKIFRWIQNVVVLGLGFVLFSLPFSVHFKPFVSGIGVVCAPAFLVKLQHLGPFLFEADHCQRSPLYQLLILYGFFYLFVLLFVFFVMRKKIKVTRESVFFIILIIVSTLLVIVPEFMYAKDIYPAHYRANTMFKLVYQSFMMLSLTVGFVMLMILSVSRKILFIPLFGFLLFFVLIYPHFAIQSYYQIPPTVSYSCKPPINPLCFISNVSEYIHADIKNYKGLDGITYLKTLHPEDYETINWMNQNILGQPVILEAQGDSYTDYARISSHTGLPTVLGWTVHEWLWRGTYDIPAPRIEEVRQMYEEQDILKTKELLKKYNVKYVYIGTLEKEKYPNLFEEKFTQLGNVVFQYSDAKLYKIFY